MQLWVDRMDKKVNYWPAWEEMLILRDRVEEFYSLMGGDNCVLSSVTWIFLREACRFLVDLVREFI